VNIKAHPSGTGSALRAASVAVCAALGLACTPEPCFPSSVGKQYRVSIVERWNESSRFAGGHYAPFPCPADFDLSPARSFVVNIDHFNIEATICSCGSGTVTQGPEGWSWTEANEVGACQGSFFQGGGRATNDTCQGRIRIEIEAKQIPTGSSIEGQAPVAWAQRSFIADYDPAGTSTCPVKLSCSERFVVEITEE
jgi:hypothetical protein